MSIFFDDGTVEVWLAAEGVQLAVDDRYGTGGAVTLSADKAREIAAALIKAAEEQEKRA